MQPQAPRALVAAALFALPIAAHGCIQRGYPLAPGGQVDVRVDVAGALFATDTLDEKGKPSGPRQAPHETGVSLFLTEGGAPAFGGYVSVRVEPREALVLRPAADEDTEEPTCEASEGSFRCIASREGFARFVAASESDWSGTATIIISWADRVEEQTIDVLPAGLPDKATNFTMIIGGLGEADKVLPTFLALQCSVGPVPDDLGSKWRPGQIRSREAYVRATPPTATPTVVENAPVIVESLFSEAALSEKADCADRRTRLRVLLGATGESEKFFLCFSDIGGKAPFAVTSGEKLIEPSPEVDVDPEPRLLRVRTVQSVVELYQPTDLFEVSAFNVNRVRIAMPVDLRSDDDQILQLGQASMTLSAEEDFASLVGVYPSSTGTARLHVSPRLLSMPDCVSDPVTVVETP
ncbi:hypothetical protein [Polyangium aurulentum]|uniref:hypothetical protein n=1 Tax=Polyangium aurulentum TaxID=2567896 RepID=UPI0010ADBAB5|nr:hypothetical protein [Polyangium aurulentum]UQA55755.1 hypothetical protein E8A73_031030 [Polyangium aurulentum]